MYKNRNNVSSRTTKIARNCKEKRLCACVVSHSSRERHENILIEVASQAISVHTSSKYRADVACLSEARLLHFGSRTITKPGSGMTISLWCF